MIAKTLICPFMSDGKLNTPYIDCVTTECPLWIIQGIGVDMQHVGQCAFKNMAESLAVMVRFLFDKPLSCQSQQP